MNATDGTPNVAAVEKSIEILELLRTQNGVTITEVADETGISKTSVYRHLQTLHDKGYVVKRGDVYHLSFQFLEFVSSARDRESGYSLIEPKVKELAEETNELAQFTVEEHDRAIFVYREVGEKAIQIAPRLGQPLHLHALAGGKAIISQWSDDRIEEFVAENGLPSHTENTITDPAEFMDQMERIRDEGHALNDQESTNGLRAVGVPVNKPNGDVLGAITISAPTNRMQDDVFHERVPDLLKGVTNEIELNFTVM